MRSCAPEMAEAVVWTSDRDGEVPRSRMNEGSHGVPGPPDCAISDRKNPLPTGCAARSWYGGGAQPLSRATHDAHKPTRRAPRGTGARRGTPPAIDLRLREKA